tara:strand:+ start:54849 stop:55688 length:840 start_codon:yes stop_codon:yes gene_type:complete
MKKILLPTDFSKNALNAIYYALKLFKGENCTFYLLNTYTPTIYNYDFQLKPGGLGNVVEVPISTIGELDDLKKDLKRKFVNAKHKFINISAFNSLTDEIKNLVIQEKIDLIVLGTKGASGIKEVVFGSNTIHIIQKVKCPVLSIPDGYVFEKPTEILFPTDYGIDFTENHLDIFKTIANNFKSKIHVLNVSLGQGLTEAEIANKERLEKLLAEFNGTYHRVIDDGVPQAINKFQISNPIKLLMMINNKHSFFENLFFKPVINKIGFHLTVPFLVIPSKM